MLHCACQLNNMCSSYEVQRVIRKPEKESYRKNTKIKRYQNVQWHLWLGSEKFMVPLQISERLSAQNDKHKVQIGQISQSQHFHDS